MTKKFKRTKLLLGALLAGSMLFNVRNCTTTNANAPLAAVYGEDRPKGVPINPAPGWQRALYFGVLLHWPLDRFLAREFLVVARPHDS